MSAAGRYMSDISHIRCLLLNSEVRFRPGSRTNHRDSGIYERTPALLRCVVNCLRECARRRKRDQPEGAGTHRAG